MSIEEYLKLSYRLELVPDVDEDGYAAYFPELPGCITMGDTVEEAVSNAMEAKKEWMQAALEDGLEIPLPVADGEYSGQFKLRLPKSLHRELAYRAKREGVSMNQYCLYLLSHNLAY